MEFTTGLMSLDTALNEMLSRVTPLTARNAATGSVFWPYSGERCRFATGCPGFDNSAMDGYAVRLADIASGNRCPLPVNPLPVSRTMVNGLRVPAFVL